MNGESREAPVPVPERPKDTEPVKEAESRQEAQPSARPETPAAAEPAAAAKPVAMSAQLPVNKDATLMKVERVLEDNLSDIYFTLPQEARAKFKSEGERTAGLIRALVDGSKVRANAVLDLIRKWLKLIPHVNRFFLQQEGKIKTDRILAIAEKRKEEIAAGVG